ncbi:histidyl-tRNA synthetase [Patellaria atrata CBS 101060]|uniref:Histidine--tRNA ligase, mitochondrial n=1 Tax=Patellaria atrata CBS 101060 TaxID=1346257 RepID=A0A9P4SEQ1_9PEZI|nr:histidyl-tRNA synthetase [Patellaria atrata CBS 101060]
MASRQVQLKTPKGTRDWFGSDCVLRDHIFETISGVFKRHGAVPLDTPVFELKDVLTGKYGEDSRLIYDLQDQGGEACSLRFDLTVPFARWLAMNKVTQVKRYQIARVYRRDQPAIARGRLREFHQIDFDIAGEYDTMIPDSEILRIIVEVFKALELDITIKMNHRKILDGIFTVAGVPGDKIRTISSAVDKLDKSPWADVKKEMTEEKGLPEEVADKIGEYVKEKGSVREILDFLKSDSSLVEDQNIRAGIEDIELLLVYVEAFNISSSISFDLSLARGLDYYTSLIFEVLHTPQQTEVPGLPKGGKDQATQVGSIGAGGRYDNLVGIFGKKPIPCVGISFGADRIYTILKAQKEREAAAPTQEIDVYVMAFGAGKEFTGLLPERLQVCGQLWDAGIRASFSAKAKPKLPQQFKAAEGVPLAVILGQDELADGKLKIKVLGLPDGHPEKEGVLIEKTDLVEEVRKRLQR